jgi:hypothetical protein
MWNSLPTKVMYLSETIVDEDDILPSDVEMHTSGFVAVDQTLEGGVPGAAIKFVFQFKFNVGQTAVRVFCNPVRLIDLFLRCRISNHGLCISCDCGLTISWTLQLEIRPSTPVRRSRFVGGLSLLDV